MSKSTLAPALNRLTYTDHGIPMAAWTLQDSQEEHTSKGRSTASIPIGDMDLLRYACNNGRCTVLERLLKDPGPMFINGKRYTYEAVSDILWEYPLQSGVLGL